MRVRVRVTHRAPRARAERVRRGGARPGEGDDARDGLHHEVAQPAAAAERGDDGRALPLEDVEDLRLRHPELVGALVRVRVRVRVRGGA